MRSNLLLNRLVIFIIIALMAGCSASQSGIISQVITRQYVQKTLAFLSSDDMKGRDAFGNEIRVAGRHIATEFGRAGLQPIPGENDFIQEISLFQSEATSGSIEIGNERIPASEVVVMTESNFLQTALDGNWEIVRVAKGENLFNAYRQLRSAEKNAILLADTSHRVQFNRLKSFGSRFMKNGHSKVVALTATPNASNVRLNLGIRVKETVIENIVGMLPGKSRPDEMVVFSAHYDHIGIGKPNEKGDSIYNGANDNASGTTGLLALAHYYGQLKNNERPIIFAAFTAEESGGYGSQYFSRQLNPDKIVALVNIEMIGTDSKWGKNSLYMTGYDKSSLGKIMSSELENCGKKNCVFRIYPDPYPDQNLFYRSDNATLARLGVPAHTVSTSKMDSEPHYHKASDEISTLDLDNMTMVIRGIAEASKSIISGQATPTRVEVENLQ